MNKSTYESYLEGEFEDKIQHYAIDYSNEIEKLNHIALSRELNPEDEYEKFFQYPEFNKVIVEEMDLLDTKTRKCLINLSEADQNIILTALTAKLYDNIVAKVVDIDYGDIPSTKGDITKLPNYNKIEECIDLLFKIAKEYKQDTKPIELLIDALSNIKNREKTFGRAFRLDIELPMVMYNNLVLSLISGVSFMIGVCIEFVKSPKDETFQIALDHLAYKRNKNHLLYTNLDKFNKTCFSGEFDKAMDFIISQRSKNLAGIALVGTVIGGSIIAIAIIRNLLSILRELVFLSYYNKLRISEFFDIQADLLLVNANNISYNELKSEEEKEKIIAKQMKTVDLFRKIANKFSIVSKESEVKSTKEIKDQSKKMKIDDLSGSENNGLTSSLF